MRKSVMLRAHFNVPHRNRARCAQCVCSLSLFGHSCNPLPPPPGVLVGDDYYQSWPILGRPGVSCDTKVPRAQSCCRGETGCLRTLPRLTAKMARFDLEELEIPTESGGREAGDGTAPDWRLYHRRRLPPVTRLPPSWALPFGRGAQFDGLRELASEYVSRKYVVLAEVSGYSTFPCQGIRRLNERAKMQAIETMSKQSVKDPRGRISAVESDSKRCASGMESRYGNGRCGVDERGHPTRLGGEYPGTVPAHGQMVGKR